MKLIAVSIDDARSMALEWACGVEPMADVEARFRQGKGLWTAVRAIWPKWNERHTEALNLYKQLRGKDMTVEILQNRVHKMYYIYKPSQNIKGHGVSSEHPDGR